MQHFRTQQSVKLTAAVAAVLGSIALFSSSAQAQQRMGSDGRLNEANNLVGSGGFNGGGNSAILPPSVMSNNIVTGDITAGRQFRGGRLGFEDPTAFRGTLAGSGVSNFVRSSTGASTSGVVTNNANQTRIYFGDNRGVNPPGNFVPLGNVPGYIPAPALGAQANTDARLGDPMSSSVTSATSPQSMYLPAGTQGGGSRSAYITANPLFGVQRLDNAQQGNNGSTAFNSTAELNNTALNARLSDLNSTINPDLTPSNNNSGSGLSGQTPLSATPGSPMGKATGDQLNPSSNTDQTGSYANNPAAGAGNNSRQLNNPNPNESSGNGSPGGSNSTGVGNNNGGGNLDAGGRISDRTSNRPINGAVPAGIPITGTIGDQRLGANVNTGEDIQTNVLNTRVSAAQGSAYNQMLRRLQAQSGNGPLTIGQRNMLQQAQMNDLKRANAKAADSVIGGNGQSADRSTSNVNAGRNSGGFGTTNVPNGTGVAPGTGGPTNVPAAAPPRTGALLPQQNAPGKARPSNIVVPSFAREETDKPTADLLAKAEDLMKQGKFSSALEQYDQVEQKSPNNPFALLGRANAELGATSYGLAEQHLRHAFSSNQALLMARYDLSAFLGNDRLQYVIKDLKDIAQANPSEARPVFLLAYICYNTNKDNAAASYLNLAQKREGKPDPFYKMLRQRWDLPDSGGPDDAEMNK